MELVGTAIIVKSDLNIDSTSRNLNYSDGPNPNPMSVIFQIRRSKSVGIG